jgi:hypothetical protein
MCHDIPDAEQDELWLYKASERINKKPTYEQIDTFVDSVLDKYNNGKSIPEARRIAFEEVFNVR